MASHTTRWRPDTCACALSFEWDDEAPDVHRVVAVEPCRTHSPLMARPDGPQAVFDAALQLNRDANAGGQ